MRLFSSLLLFKVVHSKAIILSLGCTTLRVLAATPRLATLSRLVRAGYVSFQRINFFSQFFAVHPILGIQPFECAWWPPWGGENFCHFPPHVSQCPCPRNNPLCCGFAGAVAGHLYHLRIICGWESPILGALLLSCFLSTWVWIRNRKAA